MKDLGGKVIIKQLLIGSTKGLAEVCFQRACRGIDCLKDNYESDSKRDPTCWRQATLDLLFTVAASGIDLFRQCCWPTVSTRQKIQAVFDDAPKQFPAWLCGPD